MIKSKDVDKYISNFTGITRHRLEETRKLISSLMPDSAEECISYGMPTYKLKGNLVHFAGYANHIGFYPTPAGISHFLSEIDGIYKWAKGSVQFPHTKPLPLDLIEKITTFRINKAF